MQNTTTFPEPSISGYQVKPGEKREDTGISGLLFIRCVVIVPAEFSPQATISCEMHLDMNVGTLSGLPAGETVFRHGIPFAGSPKNVPVSGYRKFRQGIVSGLSPVFREIFFHS